jgi:hypothetical protein
LVKSVLQVIDSHFAMPKSACAAGATTTAPNTITAHAITKRLTIQFLLVMHEHFRCPCMAPYFSQ